MANTSIAYPYTKSDRDKDKIMSEVMITTIIEALSPAPKFILSGTQSNMNEVIIDGYYFKLAGSATTASDLYFYTTNDATFPELYRDDQGECLFLSPKSPLPGIQHSAHVADLPTQDGLNKPYFIAAEDDTTTKQANQSRIWIKQDTMNPYVYTGVEWVPLGAVYKSTI